MSTVLLEREVWSIQSNSILVAERWTLGGQARKARTFLCERKNAASSRARRGQAAVGGGFCMSRNTQGAEEGAGRGHGGGREGDTETDTWQSYHQPPLSKTINTNFLKEQWIIKEANRWNFTFQLAFYFESIHWVKETHEISVLDNFLKIKSKCLPGLGPDWDHQQQQQEPVGSRRRGGHCNYCPGRRCLVPPHANTRDQDLPPPTLSQIRVLVKLRHNPSVAATWLEIFITLWCSRGQRANGHGPMDGSVVLCSFPTQFRWRTTNNERDCDYATAM